MNQDNSICSQIYQEGAQDSSCYVRNPSTLQTTLQCYNPMCYNCSSYGTLCPANAPLACGIACYSPQQYSCNIDTSNFFNSQLVQIPGGVNTLTLNPYCPGSGSPLAGTVPSTVTVTPPSTGSNTVTQAPSTGNDVSSSICSSIYQEGAQDHSCFVYNPMTGTSTEQCYNPACYNCTATNQLCPANYPLSCGMSCYSSQEYTCNVNSANTYASTLVPIQGGKNTATLNPYCPGSGSPLAGTTPNVTVVAPPQPQAIQPTSTPTVTSVVISGANVIAPTSSICSQIYQEGQQDQTCYVINPANGNYTAQCYNPQCYNCTTTGQLCPTTAPLACGAACYSPVEYTCNVNSQNFFASTLQSTGQKSTATLYPYCPGSGSPLAGTTPGVVTQTAPTTGQSVQTSTSSTSAPAAIVSTGALVSSQSDICSQIYQEGVQDHSCTVINPVDLTSIVQCYNPRCYNCSSTGQLCPANAPLACGAACYDPSQYSCNVNSANFFASQLVQIPGGKASLSIWEYCPGSGSPLAGTTPGTQTQTPSQTPPSTGQQVISPPAVVSPPQTNSSTICSQIYQEGAQDQSCYVINPSNGQQTLYCYNPTCYNCTSTGQLCPANYPLACGAACYSPQEYTCNVNNGNFFASTLSPIQGGKNTATLNAYCPGSGSPLAGTTPNTTVAQPPASGAYNTGSVSTPAPSTSAPTTAARTVAPTTAAAQAAYSPPVYSPPATSAPAASPNAVVNASALVSSGSGICAHIYQEGAQDSSCQVLNPATGATTEYCYNPTCYSCTGTGQLCPANFPSACGVACYDPSQYSCSVDSGNFYNSKLVAIQGGSHTLTLNPYCPGSGSPLAGTTPNTQTVQAPSQ